MKVNVPLPRNATRADASKQPWFWSKFRNLKEIPKAEKVARIRKKPDQQAIRTLDFCRISAFGVRISLPRSIENSEEPFLLAQRFIA